MPCGFPFLKISYTRVQPYEMKKCCRQTKTHTSTTHHSSHQQLEKKWCLQTKTPTPTRHRPSHLQLMQHVKHLSDACCRSSGRESSKRAPSMTQTHQTPSSKTDRWPTRSWRVVQLKARTCWLSPSASPTHRRSLGPTLWCSGAENEASHIGVLPRSSSVATTFGAGPYNTITPLILNSDTRANRCRQMMPPPEPRWSRVREEDAIPDGFLRCDVRMDDASHIIMATQQQLRILQTAKRLYLDGNSKSYIRRTPLSNSSQ